MDTREESIDPGDKRLPYEKPAVVAEEEFETTALSCAKTTGVFSCRFDQANS